MSKTTDIATIAVVALLGAGGFLIYKNRNEIGDFFGGIGKGAQDFADGIGKGVGEFTDGIGNWYGETVSNIQQGVDDLGKNVGGFFDGVVNGFTETVTGIQSGIAGALDGAGDFFGETVTGIQSGIAGAVSGIGDFFGGLFKREDEGATMTPAPTKKPYGADGVINPVKPIESEVKGEPTKTLEEIKQTFDKPIREEKKNALKYALQKFGR